MILHLFIVNFSKRESQLEILWSLLVLERYKVPCESNQLISKSSSKSSRYYIPLNRKMAPASDWLFFCSSFVVGIRFFFIWFEVRFFNFATNKAKCYCLTLILNMACSNQNNYQIKTIIIQIVSAFKESAGPGVNRLHKYHLWYFRQHFPDIGYWECASYANSTVLSNFIEKKMKVVFIANIVKKSP